VYLVSFPCLCFDPSTIRMGIGMVNFRIGRPSLLASVGVRKLSVAPLLMSAFLTFQTPERNIGICIALGNVTQVVHTCSPLAMVKSSGAVKNPCCHCQNLVLYHP